MALAPNQLPPVQLASGIRLYPTYAVIPDGLPMQDYVQAIDMLEFLGRGHQWYLGDVLLSADAVYGDSIYNQVHERTGLRDKTLANFVTIARRFEPSRRRDSDWSFHEAVGHLESDADQDRLLDQAESEGWSVMRLRQEVRHLASNFVADSTGFTDEEVSVEQHARLAGGDRVDVALLEDSPWPNDEVDLLLTSPPYGTGMQYADGGDVADYSDYLELVDQWAKAICRLVNPRHGRVAINVPLDKADNAGKRGRPSYTGRPVYADWVFSLVQAGLSYRSTVLWLDRDAGEGNQRGSIDSPSAPHVVAPCEAIILMFRGSWSRSSERAHDLSHAEWLEDLGPRGLWQINGTTMRADHPAPWPDELPERLIKLLSFRGDLICDPMCGQGTAGRIGASLGRKVWMADRSPQYVEVARQALLEARGAAVEAVA